MTDTPSRLLFAGTHRRAHHADPADIAFGIYSFRLIDGVPQQAAMTETPQPGWVALGPWQDYLYAVNEVRDVDGRPGGAVSSFSVDRQSGRLQPLNSMPTPAMPCHCSVDATGRFLLVATFGGGSVHLFGINPDGSIGAELDRHIHQGSSIHPLRQASPHAHAVAIDPSNSLVLVPDLGTDRLYVYGLDHDGERLIAMPSRTVALPPGSGPRHVAFNPTGTRVYLINEMSAKISVLSLGPNGTLALLQSADLLPTGFEGLRSGASLNLHPSGSFLYATTRSHGSSGAPPGPGLDTIVWFAIDPNGLLEFQGRAASGGSMPRSAVFDEESNLFYVANQCSGTIATFSIGDDGRPQMMGVPVSTPVPVCLQPMKAQ